MTIYGWYHFGEKRVSCKSAYCSECGVPSVVEGRKSFVWVHLFFVPLLPVARVTRWFCTGCGEEPNRNRPSRPCLLMAGIPAALVMVLVGVAFLIGDGASEDGLGLLLFGAVLLILVVWSLRSNRSADYRAATLAVRPLDGSSCPLCGLLLPPGREPHCPKCDVAIITGTPPDTPRQPRADGRY